MAKKKVELRETVVWVCVNASGYPFGSTVAHLRRDSIASWNKLVSSDFENDRKKYGIQVVKSKLVPVSEDCDMSEQVNIEQVRDEFPLLANTEQKRVVLQMADELERLREFREYCDKYHNGIYEQFDEWRQR